MGLFLCMVQRVTTVLRILKKVNGTSLSGLHPVFHSIRSPWLYADKVGVGSLGRTFRRSRNSAGGHSPLQACRQARSAPPASSAAFPQQRRVRLQSTKKKELSSIKKDPFRGLLLCSRCLPLHNLRAEHYALVYSVSSQYIQDRLCCRHALVIQHIIQRRQCRRGHLRIKRVVDPDH